MDTASINPEIIALVALVISFMSILLTFLSLRNQHIHNRKSVRPIASIILGDYEQRIFVKIVNSGIGPLIIDKIEIFNKNIASNNLIDMISIEPPEGLEWKDYVIETEGRALRVSEELILLEIEGLDATVDEELEEEYELFIEALRKFLYETTIVVNYTDLYEKKFKVRRELTLFEDY